jgi:hypothetical protein
METIKRIGIYGCGGAGTNLLAMTEKKIATENLTGVYSPYVPVYIDSSESNFDELPAGAETYRIEGMNGAGKHRDEMLEPARREAANILFKYPPQDVNILVSSAGGGTGAVLATVLAEKMWEAGKRVIFVSPASIESGKTARNSLAHVRTLNNRAKANNQTSVLFYDNNEAENKERNSVDRSMVLGICALLDLYSGHHREMDTKDVENWLNLGKSANLEPQLVLLDIDTAIEDAKARQYPISMAVVYSKDDEAKGSPSADYLAEGFRTDGGKSLFFSIHTEGLGNIAKELDAVVKNYDQRGAARQSAANSALGGSTASDGWEM